MYVSFQKHKERVGVNSHNVRRMWLRAGLPQQGHHGGRMGGGGYKSSFRCAYALSHSQRDNQPAISVAEARITGGSWTPRAGGEETMCTGCGEETWRPGAEGGMATPPEVGG